MLALAKTATFHYFSHSKTKNIHTCTYKGVCCENLFLYCISLSGLRINYMYIIC